MADEPIDMGKVMETLAMARRAGWPEPLLRLATAVFMGESRGYQERVGDLGIQDETWGPSVGLAQVRTMPAQRGSGGSRDIERVAGDPLENLRAALELYQGRPSFANGKKFGEPGGFPQWAAYNDGSYKRFLDALENVTTVADRVR